MARPKKKRTKAYRGNDAKQRRPTIVRVTAENRGPVKQWWVDNKRLARPVLIVLGALAALGLLIQGLLSIF